MNRTYTERKKAGLCVNCGSDEVVAGLTAKLCQCCKDKQKKRSRNYMQTIGTAARRSMRKNTHKDALRIISKSEFPTCFYCACDDPKQLEIHHINNDGKKDLRNKKGSKRTYPFYRDIVNGKREIDDLLVVCRVCNVTKFAEIKARGHWEVKWIGTCCDMCNDDCKYEYATLIGTWGYYSNKDGESHKLIICEKCYDKVKSFIESVGGKIRVKEY